MKWQVFFHSEFQAEFEQLKEEVQDELLALGELGPNLGRPNVDTLTGSKFKNMKELRFQLDGVWRFAFAFDPQRNAIVLCGGDKENENSKRFYDQLIETADRRFTAHIASQRKVAKE
ncbi:MAG TPA: type II toxin-antitoxin system RelE/ParE family toxin [Pseudolabrys sp.]